MTSLVERTARIAQQARANDEARRRPWPEFEEVVAVLRAQYGNAIKACERDPRRPRIGVPCTIVPRRSK